jgi:hypothetical protein
VQRSGVAAGVGARVGATVVMLAIALRTDAVIVDLLSKRASLVR